jgi:hypothetical protein
LIVSSDFRASSRFLDFADNQGIEIMEKCDGEDGLELFGHMVRYQCEAEWIEKHIRVLDRVMHSDSYDVFFQGDPFQAVIPRREILLVKENLRIADCDWNTQWIKECYGRKTWEQIKENNIVCTGIIAGGAREYLRLVQYMRSRSEWRVCWDTSKDQPIFNNLLWGGAFRVHGFKFAFTGCFEGIFTMHWCQGYGSTRLYTNKENVVVTPKGDVPFVLHQYNRYQVVIDHLAAKCGMSPFPHV